MLKLITRNLKRYTPQVIVVVVMVFLQVLSDLYLPTLNSDITNNGIALGDVNYILRTGGKMLLIVGLSAICSIIASYFSSRTAMGFGRDVRKNLFTHIESLSMGDIDEIGTASLITRATNDITQVQNSIMLLLRMMLMAPIMCIGGIIMARQKSPELSWIIVAVLPILLIVMIFMLKKGMPLFKSMQKKIDRVNQVVREGLTGIRVIRAFNKNEYEKERFDVANLDLTDTALKVNRLMAFLMPFLMLIVNATNIALIWIGGHKIVSGDIQVGDLTAFITYIMLILMSFMMCAMLFVVIPRASASAERINEILEIQPTVMDQADGSGEKAAQKGLVFEQVSFSYPDAEAPVLKDISFEAKPGEMTAIIGGTGSGKSTLINLIPRFYDVSAGAVKINGKDIRNYNQEELRSKIGVIPQKAFLFGGTIADNLKFGKEDATEEEMMKALEIAQAKEFVLAKEEGLEATISQGGSNVSGGQRQRLAIARALIRRPDIYVFDDSFSALDFKTDAKLRSALKEEIHDAAMIVVAQRVSSITSADQILVLDDGEIVGCGTHKELLQSCEVYQEIVYSQMTESEVG